MLRHLKYESRKGFTLVELVVVLVILAVLTSVAVPAFSRQTKTTRENKAVTEAQSCVTAATGLAAQKYAQARTAYVQNSRQTIDASLAAWAGKVADNGPADVTGTLAQREGNGTYLLDPAGTLTGTATATGAEDIKAAAEVDGTVLNFWCSSTGQIVYLLYRSTDNILVAYVNQATAGGNGVVIPTANVPTPTKLPDQPGPDPDPTPGPEISPIPTPDTGDDKPDDKPDITGPKLIIHLEDGATKEALVNLSFRMYRLGHSEESFTVTTNGNGDIEVGIQENGAAYKPYYMNEHYSYVLEDITVPDGYQAMKPTNFAVAAVHRSGEPYDIIGISNVNINNLANNEYKTVDGGEHILHIPRYKVPYVYFRTVDSNGTRLNGAAFTLVDKTGVTVATFTSNASKDYDYSIPVKRNAADGIRQRIYIDLSGNDTNRTFTLTQTTAPDQYNSVASQDFTVSHRYSGSGAYTFDVDFLSTIWGTGYTLENDSPVFSHVITITNQPKDTAAPVESTCQVTIGKMVYTYKSENDKAPSGTAFLPADKPAVLKLTGNSVSETWSTQGTGKTFKLLPGTYRLEEQTVPYGYLKAAPITFTVKPGDTELPVNMLDLTTRDENENIVIPGETATITFIPKSWAHKLTNDDEIRFNKELLSMNGVLYYNYNRINSTIDNPNRNSYAAYFGRYGVLPGDAPNPIEFLDKHNDKGSENVIRLTGKVYEWKEGSTFSLTKGDIVIYSNKGYIFNSDDAVKILTKDDFNNDSAREKAGFLAAAIGAQYLNIKSFS